MSLSRRRCGDDGQWPGGRRVIDRVEPSDRLEPHCRRIRTSHRSGPVRSGGAVVVADRGSGRLVAALSRFLLVSYTVVVSSGPAEWRFHTCAGARAAASSARRDPTSPAMSATRLAPSESWMGWMGWLRGAGSGSWCSRHV